MTKCAFSEQSRANRDWIHRTFGVLAKSSIYNLLATWHETMAMSGVDGASSPSQRLDGMLAW
jgi:hypothetical protein